MYERFKLAGVLSPGLCKFNLPTRDEGWDKQQGKGSSGTRLVQNQRPAVEFDVELELWKDNVRDCFAEWAAFKPILRQARIKTTPAPKLGADASVVAAHNNLLATQNKYQGWRPTTSDPNEAKRQILEAQQALQLAKATYETAVRKSQGTPPVAKTTIEGVDIYYPSLAEIDVKSVVVKNWTGVQPNIGGQKKGGGIVKIRFIENAPPSALGVGAASGSKTGGVGQGKGAGRDPNADLKAKVADLTKRLETGT